TSEDLSGGIPPTTTVRSPSRWTDSKEMPLSRSFWVSRLATVSASAERASCVTTSSTRCEPPRRSSPRLMLKCCPWARFSGLVQRTRRMDAPMTPPMIPALQPSFLISIPTSPPGGGSGGLFRLLAGDRAAGHVHHHVLRDAHADH